MNPFTRAPGRTLDCYGLYMPLINNPPSSWACLPIVLQQDLWSHNCALRTMVIYTGAYGKEKKTDRLHCAIEYKSVTFPYQVSLSNDHLRRRSLWWEAIEQMKDLHVFHQSHIQYMHTEEAMLFIYSCTGALWDLGPTINRCGLGKRGL